MSRIFAILVFVVALLSCKDNNSNSIIIEQQIEFNQELADELERMAEIDQIAAGVPRGRYKEMTIEEWKAFKDSVFTTHAKYLNTLFKTYGFVGYDLAGEQGSFNFWLMTQHSDHNPEFQKAVLEKMKIEVDNNNADSGNYGFLVDRVNLNTGEAQVYGTQVTYNTNTGQAYPRKLMDSARVNDRRKLIGLEPLEIYLNRMSEMHFEINKDGYLKMGITAPKLYNVE